MSRRTAIACSSLLAGFSLAAPAGAPADGRYVAIGDSIAGGSNSYVSRFATTLGITDVRMLISGETAAGAARSQLPAADALIRDATDTAAVTVQLGGHDFLTGNCKAGWNRADCDFADGLSSVLAGLRDALDADPGAERFVVVAYYNPASGRGDADERSFDRGLRGTDGRVDAASYGDAWGMTDIIGWLACRHGAALADPWAAFKAGGQSLMADSLHPTAAGQELIARIVADPPLGGPTPSCPATTPFAVTKHDRGDGQARGVVEPRLAPARWWFEYGSSTAYGSTTEPQTLPPSAGPRAVAVTLPAAWKGRTAHVRLVVENGVGRFAAADQPLAVPDLPALSATGPARRSRRALLRRGLPVRIGSTGTVVTAEGKLRRAGRDPVVLRRRMAWHPGGVRRIRLRLTQRGRRLVTRSARTVRLSVRLTATGPGGVSPPVRLTLRVG